MFWIAAAAMGLCYWLYNYLNGKVISDPEWLGLYNELEATLLETDAKVYNEDIAKGALIYAGAAYQILNFEGCLPDFKINTLLSTTIKGITIGGFVGDYDHGKYIVAAFEGTRSN